MSSVNEPNLTKRSANFDGMPKIQLTKVGNIKRRVTQKAVCSSKAERDVNTPSVQ